MLKCTEGYGINLSDLTHEIKTDNLLDLIKTAPKFYKSMSMDLFEMGADIEICETYNILTDWVNTYGDVKGSGLAEILQKVIEEIEDIRFDVVVDIDDNSYLVFTPNYPWMGLNDKEKQLTEEKIDEIIEKYLSIATADALYPYYLSIELE